MGSGSTKALDVEPIVGPTVSKQGVTLGLLKRLEQMAIEHEWVTTSAVVDGLIKPAIEAIHQEKLTQIKALESAPVKERQGLSKGKQPAVIEVVDITCCSIEGMMKTNHSEIPHPIIALTYSQCFTPTATVFVSHCRDQPFSVLVSTLESFVAEKKAKKPGKVWSFWIDFLVSNEWENKGEYPIKWYTDVYPAHIAEIGCTVVVVSPGNKPVAFRNMWCLYEIVMSLKHFKSTSLTSATDTAGTADAAGKGSSKVYFHMCAAEREAFVATLEEDFVALLSGWSDVDLRTGVEGR